MSGRKDYSYVLEAARIAAQKAEIAARRAARARETHVRLERAKVDALRLAAALGQEQRERNQERMKQAALNARLTIQARETQSRQPVRQAERQEENDARQRESVEVRRQAEIGQQQEAKRQQQAAAAQAAELQAGR